jgi:hypothetical protein
MREVQIKFIKNGSKKHKIDAQHIGPVLFFTFWDNINRPAFHLKHLYFIYFKQAEE